MEYEHTQHAPLHWLLVATALAIAVAIVPIRGEPLLVVTHALVAGVLFLLSLMFRWLTVCDEGDCLAVRFGPLPMFGTRISYADIEAVGVGRSSLLDGWGVHWIPGRGTTYNLWGFSCVELAVRGRTVRIGSDDAERLAAFLQARIDDPRD